MSVMKDKIFVDSNIWIYLFTSDDISKNELARKFIAENTSKGNVLVVSYQVINEVGAVLKMKKKFEEMKIRYVFEAMLDLCVCSRLFKRNNHESIYYTRHNVCVLLG